MEATTTTTIIRLGDANYPPRLIQLPDPPRELYVRGEFKNIDLPWVAVIGARKPTAYGLAVTKKLVGQIAPHCVVVSGLAYGIDAAAHQAAIEAGGLTVAVLGSGVDDESVYPSKHKELANRIVATGGAVISEYPDGTYPAKHHFPMRNRIIAGLADKVVVVEAGEISGTIITARLALDYNRDVMAVPGPINSPNSVGTNQLIASGAGVVTRAEDIVQIQSSQVEFDLTDSEQMIYKALVSGCQHLDEIVLATNLPSATVGGLLTMLELKGVIMALPGGKFSVR